MLTTPQGTPEPLLEGQDRKDWPPQLGPQWCCFTISHWPDSLMILMTGQRGGSAWWSSWLSVSMEGSCGRACREELPIAHGAAVRGLQSLCAPLLSPSFSLAKSTCKICYRGEGNIAVKLLKSIFTGFGLATALLQALKCLFRCSCSVLFLCWWDQIEIYWTWSSRKSDRVILNPTSSDHRSPKSLPSSAHL